MGLAVKIGTELVGGVLVGVGIGWMLDRWLGTKPWLMVVFFVLGAVAGMVGVIRTVSGIGHGVGVKPAERERKDGEKSGG
jgi:ATP synthase protein I